MEQVHCGFVRLIYSLALLATRLADPAQIYIEGLLTIIVGNPAMHYGLQLGLCKGTVKESKNPGSVELLLLFYVVFIG